MNNTALRWTHTLALVLVCLSCGARARADAVIAHQHFEAGVRAFDEQRLADAAAEFERAYEAEPSWALLYNLGSVYAALGDPVRSLDCLRRYLAQGATRIAPERREQVELELERQRAKVGTLLVRSEPAGADVRVDGVAVGRTPLAPLERSAGLHGVDVAREGYRPIHQQVQVVAMQTRTLELELVLQRVPAPAALPDTHTGRAQRIVGFTLGGAGLAGLGVGAALLVQARSKHADAVELATRGMRPRAERLESDSSRQQTLSYAVIGVAAAVFLAGALLVISAPTPFGGRARVEASPWLSAGTTGLRLHSAW